MAKFPQKIRTLKKALEIKLQEKSARGELRVTRKTFQDPITLRMTPEVSRGLTRPLLLKFYRLNRGIPFVPALPRPVRTASGRCPKSVLYRNPRGCAVVEDATALTPYDLFAMATFDVLRLVRYVKAKRSAYVVFLLAAVAGVYCFFHRQLSRSDWVEADLDVSRQEMVEAIERLEALIKSD